MSLPKKDRNLRSENSNDGAFPDRQGAAEFALAVSKALRSDYGGRGPAVKRVARLTGANERAVKNWFEGRNAPTGYHLVLLAGHSDEVLRLILVRAGRKDSLVSLDIAAVRTALARAAATLDGIGG